MADDAENGQVAAHTPPEAGGRDADPAAGGDLDNGGGIDGRAVDDLLTGSPDLADTDMLAMAAELSAAPRRARGRPPGSPNRKNADMIGYLAALGHRDPWVTLSMIQTADTRTLAQALRAPAKNKNGSPVKDAEGNFVLEAPDYAGTLALQKSAAETLMAYHHAKMPVQLEMPVDGDRVPWMAIGEMNVHLHSSPMDGLMSAGEVIDGEKANEINGRSVRIQTDNAHDVDKPLKTKDDPASID